MIGYEVIPTIARNTAWLWLRLAVRTASGLVALKVVVGALGNVGYGAYVFLAGIVGLTGLLNGMFCEASTRYLGYSAGANGKGDVRPTFLALLAIALLFAIVSVVFGETFGLWQSSRITAQSAQQITDVNFVYQVMLVTSVVNILRTPVESLARALERMRLVAQISICESLTALVVAGLLLLAPPECRLRLYVGSELLVSLFFCCVFVINLRRAFLPIGIRDFSSSRLVNAFSYCSMSSLRSIANIVRNRGSQVSVSSYFGLLTGGAWSMAFRCGEWAIAPVGCFRDAFMPRLAKLWSSGQKDAFYALVWACLGVCGGVYLLIATPIWLFAPQIGEWLGAAESFADILRSFLVFFGLNAIVLPVHSAVAAEEHIGVYQLVVAMITLGGFVATLEMLMVGLHPAVAAWGFVLGEGCNLVFRISYLVTVLPRRIRRL